MTDLHKFQKVPLAELSTPKHGRECFCDHWWSVVDECVFFYDPKGARRYSSPQCNTNKAIVERLATVPNAEARFIPALYLPHRCEDNV